MSGSYHEAAAHCPTMPTDFRGNDDDASPGPCHGHAAADAAMRNSQECSQQNDATVTPLQMALPMDVGGKPIDRSASTEATCTACLRAPRVTFKKVTDGMFRHAEAKEKA